MDTYFTIKEFKKWLKPQADTWHKWRNFTIKEFKKWLKHDNSNGRPFKNFTIKEFKKWLKPMASCFIMWKLIVGGAEWTMRYIGIDKDNDSTIAQSMSQHLERRAYNVM